MSPQVEKTALHAAYVPRLTSPENVPQIWSSGHSSARERGVVSKELALCIKAEQAMAQIL